MPQTSGRVLVVDDDASRLGAVSEALREKGHEVHAFGAGAEAREWLVGWPGIDVVLATAAVASELDETRRETARGAAWILRDVPSARSPEHGGKFIASVPFDASPRAVAETV
ncbi:MAG: hypothetical protein M3Y87_25375, partial [Myxococcota bacterium]|nr:hypothetical protein [Myxococcota bacterium]